MSHNFYNDIQICKIKQFTLQKISLNKNYTLRVKPSVPCGIQKIHVLSAEFTPFFRPFAH